MSLVVAVSSVSAHGGDRDDDYRHGGQHQPKVGVSVANYIVNTWPNLDDATCGVNCFSLNYATVPAAPAPKFFEYTNGVPLYGMWKIYKQTGEKKYFDYIKKWMDTLIDANGNINYTSNGSPTALRDPTIQDTMQPATLLIALYQETKDPRYLTAASKIRATINTIQKNPQGAFWHKPTYPNQQWLDGIYMSEPFLAKYGKLYADKAIPGDSVTAFNTVTTQIKLADQFTFNPTKNLYYHAWNGAADGVWKGLKMPPLTGQVTTSVLWSRSIAWYYLGVIDVLDSLPERHPDRRQLERIVRNISQALYKYQDRKTGLWNQVIDVTNDKLPANGGYPAESVAALPNWNETSASALFVYGLAKSVRKGYISPLYEITAREGWKGVKTQVEIAGASVKVHGTVVGMSVGGTYNSYVNADFRTDLTTGPLPAPTASCPTPPAFTSPPVVCKTIFVRDNVPQGLGAVMLAASEMEDDPGLHFGEHGGHDRH